MELQRGCFVLIGLLVIVSVFYIVIPSAAGDSIATDTVSARSPVGNTTDPFAAIDEKLAPGEAAALKSLIQNTLHAFSYDNGTGAWYARNAENRITFVYTGNGMAEFSNPAGTFGLSLNGVGREGAIAPAANGAAAASGRQLNITRPGFTEWYRNHDEGVEQGVTVMARPAGTGPLLVRFGIADNSSFSPGSGQALTVTDNTGSPLFTYTGLHAFSADGRELPSSLATDGTTLLWIVDDAGAVYPVTVDPVVASASTAAATFSGGADGDFFGYSVSLSSDGSRALVGAANNDTAGLNAGAVYLFEMPGGGWSGTTSVSAATATFTGGAANDRFGSSVSLSSDGSRVLVGANSNSTASLYAGAAYLFEMPGGGWSGTTSASDATATFTGGAPVDIFGSSVTLSPDGSSALIGAYYNDTAGPNAGAAYFFEMPVGGWSGTTSASDATAMFTGGTTGDLFGWSVALSSDSSRALVGALLNGTAGPNAGAAYFFEMPVGGWSGTTSASDATAIFTGGATGDMFGGSIVLSSDGSRALVGAVFNDTAGLTAGAVYLFEMPVGGWSGTTSASDATATIIGNAAGARFGNSVSLSSDSSRALIGANEKSNPDWTHGAAYLFEMPGGGWSGTTSASDATATFTGTTNEQFGRSVSLSSDGSRALVGEGYGSGFAYIFQPPYVTLTAGGTTTGAAGTVVNGLTLSPTGTLTNVDLYLGTDTLTPLGTAIRTGIPSLPVSTATTVDGLDLTGKTPGTYYLIACESGTTMVLGATATAAYTVINPAPAISSITPPTGMNTSSVDITNLVGTDFDTTTLPAVKLNRTGYADIDATSVVTLSDTQITCTFPITGAEAGLWNVVVTNPDGQEAMLVNGFTITAPNIIPPPAVTGITPATGMNTTGISITNLAGSNFNTTFTPAVMLNRTGYADIVATGVATPSSSQITCTLPITGAEAGPWNVVVTNPDGQEAMLANGFTITAPAPTTVPTTTVPTAVPTTYHPDDDSGNTLSDFPPSGFPLMTVVVNIGGDSKAWQAIVTGTKLSDLIMTGTVQSGAGDGNFTVPPGIVFQYISLVPARYNTITNAVINFTVPQSWLEENHIDPGSIVLYRLTANGWEALPTTVLYTKDGTVYFSAVSPGFSLFAIAGTPTVLTPPGVAVTQEPASTPAVREQVPAPAPVAKAPVTTLTTAPPAPSSVPIGSSPFPVVPLLIGIGCVGLIGGGWYIRRWWIRRQNPALFIEYD